MICVQDELFIVNYWFDFCPFLVFSYVPLFYLLQDDVESDDEEEKEDDDLVDVEDVAGMMSNYISSKEAANGTNGLVKMNRKNTRREMATPELRKALTKQGYRIIGSHSGVKLCRWTKSMLRGIMILYNLAYI